MLAYRRRNTDMNCQQRSNNGTNGKVRGYVYVQLGQVTNLRECVSQNYEAGVENKGHAAICVMGADPTRCALSLWKLYLDTWSTFHQAYQEELLRDLERTNHQL